MQQKIRFAAVISDIGKLLPPDEEDVKETIGCRESDMAGGFRLINWIWGFVILNFEVFLFLLFMSLVSFAVGMITWVAVVRIFGRGTQIAKVLSYVLIPIVVLAYNFLVIISGDYRYLIGSIPLLLIAVYALYYRFGNHGMYIEMSEEASQTDFKRKQSAKSRKIHEAREKRNVAQSKK